MTIQDIKEKYGLTTLDFYRIYGLDEQKTKWLKATNKQKSIVFVIHEYYFEKLRENRHRQDISIESKHICDANGNHFDRHILTLTGLLFNVTLFEIEHTVCIIPTIKNISFNKIQNFEEAYKKSDTEFFGLFEPSYLRDKICIEFEIIIGILALRWKIPYAIILEKTYCKENSKMNYIYRKCRTRRIKIEEIEVLDDMLHPYLIHTLLLLDRSRIDYITSNEFENQIHLSSFFFNSDLKHNSNKNCIYIVSNSCYQTQKENYTNIQFKREEQFSFKEYYFKSGYRTEGCYFLNIFPIGFFDSYAEKIIDDNGDIINLHSYFPLDKSIEGSHNHFNTIHAATKGDKLFQGSHDECLLFLENKQNIIAIKNSISKNINKLQTIAASEESFDYYNNGGWKADYFDAMTGGQIGTFDEFIENGCDIDNLENYI